MGDIFLIYLKQCSAPRVLIRYTLCKLNIVNQYNINKSYLVFKKWFTENPKYFEAKYDSKLN